MTSTQTLEQPTLATCATCPYFQDFGEPNGRGWCLLFDQMARQQHNRTGGCEQEISAVESAQQEPVIALKSQSPEAGLAGDSVRSQLQSLTASGATLSPNDAPQQLESKPERTPKASTEFEQGRVHGLHDATARLHPIYTKPNDAYASGYLSGYSSSLANQPPRVTQPVEWSVTYNDKWGWYDIWLAHRWIGRADSHDEAERMATKRVALDEIYRRQNAAVLGVQQSSEQKTVISL